MPQQRGKLGLVDLFGERSTNEGQTPKFTYSYLKKVERLSEDFCYRGKLNGKVYSFRVDTSSDVSIINNKFIKETERKFDVGDCKLRYLTEENVSVKFKIDTEVELGKFFIKISMFGSEIFDDCLLRVDFLRRINLNNIFESAFGDSNVIQQVARVEEFAERVSFFLKELFVNNSKNLNEKQREIFIDFLKEFQDVFSKDVIARSDIVEHVINLKDSLPIKQVPRRIPFQMRDEVNKIIEDIRKQGVIEESQSLWILPAVLVKKKDGTIRFCVDFRKLNSKKINFLFQGLTTFSISCQVTLGFPL